MSVVLTKKEKVSLTKGTQGLSRVFMGLGWDVAKPKKSGGLFGGLFGGGGDEQKSIDLDSSCLMFDANRQLVDQVWFRQLRSQDGSITHNGDNRTGAGEGDDEVINVNLEQLPSNVTTLVFVINSFTGQTFEQVESAYCRLVNAQTNTELARYNLSGKNAYTGQIMVRVYKENGVWTMQALGEASSGRTFHDMLPQVQGMI